MIRSPHPIRALVIAAATVAALPLGAAPAIAASDGIPSSPPPAVDTSDLAAHHHVTVRLSTLMHRRGDVVTPVLIQGPDPYTGRPGWSQCHDLPQSGLPIWNDLDVRLAYPAVYTISSYSDFACSNGYDYRWSTGTIDTRFTHWIVYTFRSPKISLR